jgi:fibronectin-binding autotransporter adhesin
VRQIRNGRRGSIPSKLNRCNWPVAAAVLVLWRGQLTQAAPQPATWEGNSAAGGDGVNWTNSHNWTTNGVADVAPPATAPGDDLTFGNGTVGTINLQGNEFANSLTFNAGFTLDAPGSTNTLTLASGNVNVGSSVFAAINSKLAGAGGLNLSGAGSLLLDGTDTYSGGTTINGGTLVAGGGSALPVGSINVGSGGSLLIDAGTGGNYDVTNNGSIQVAANQTLRVPALNQNAGQIQVGSGGLLDLAGNPLDFDGGTITLDAGTSAQGRIKFGSSYIDDSTTAPVTIASGPVGPGQSPGYVDLGERNPYVPMFSVSPGPGPVQMIISAGITDGHLSIGGGGVLELSGDNTYDSGTEVDNGALLIAAADSIPTTGGISIETGGLVQLATGIGGPTTQGLSIERKSDLDIANNRLFINYSGSADPISTVAGYIDTGYNDGAWNGNEDSGVNGGLGGGIISSAAAANSGSYGIGYADSADPGNPAGLASGTIEIMYTLLGDANLDGVVNGDDFTLMATNFGQSGRSWDQGDFNYDGVVNSEDFTLLSDNFSMAASQSAAAADDLAALDAFAAANGISLANVPEPGAMLVMGMILAGALGRRRRTSFR